MYETATILITLGALLFVGVATDAIGRRTCMPRVTLLIVFGFVIGPSVLNFLPRSVDQWLPLVANMALAMIGFLLGGKLTRNSLRAFGNSVLWISFLAVIGTVFIVSVGLMFLGVPVAMALLLGGLSAATDPAATVAVIDELKADGPFTRILLGVVALDDLWALIAFTLTLIMVNALQEQGNVAMILATGAWDVFGAVLLGVLLGIPMAYLTGHIGKGEPTQIEALSLVFLCSGVAIWLHVSFLLASMVLGSVVANFAHYHKRPFHEIENIEWPFMVLFFILAGASLHLATLLTLGLVGLSYVFLRIVARVISAWYGGKISKTPATISKWMGMALMPQAGVALGMALVVMETFPKLGAKVLPIVLGATIFFEIIGPFTTRYSLFRVNEVKKREN